MSLSDREAELLETLVAVIDAELPYVLVGGWAIAAFDPRFTADVDVVIPSQSIDDYTALLTDRGYENVADIERNDLYEGRTLRFEKDIVDILPALKREDSSVGGSAIDPRRQLAGSCALLWDVREGVVSPTSRGRPTRIARAVPSA